MLLITVIVIHSSVPALHDFDILNFDVEQVETDSDGRVFFIIKIDIRNNHQPGKIVAHVIALNKSGRVIKSHHIRGDFTADEVRELSLRTFLTQGEYDDFGEWRLKETVKYGKK
jgi:hypothetical protein